MITGYRCLPKFTTRKSCRQVDEHGNTKMTAAYLKQLCREQSLYQTPELNDKLYLQYQGFATITEDIKLYTGLKTLWFEGNGVDKIQHLEEMTEMRCLFFQNNCLFQIENISTLIHLDTLNVSNNFIRSLGNELRNLPVLRTLQISGNQLSDIEGLEELRYCKLLSILDLSNNRIEDPAIFNILESMPELRVLNLMGNSVIRKTTQYRRNTIARCQQLTYLDDRPVFDNERLAVKAWLTGGLEAERAERVRQREEEREKHNRDLEYLREIQEKARERRKRNYPDERPVEFTPSLQKFYNDMLDKLEPEMASETNINGSTDGRVVEEEELSSKSLNVGGSSSGDSETTPVLSSDLVTANMISNYVNDNLKDSEESSSESLSQGRGDEEWENADTIDVRSEGGSGSTIHFMEDLNAPESASSGELDTWAYDDKTIEGLPFTFFDQDIHVISEQRSQETSSNADMDIPPCVSSEEVVPLYDFKSKYEGLLSQELPLEGEETTFAVDAEGLETLELHDHRKALGQLHVSKDLQINPWIEWEEQDQPSVNVKFEKEMKQENEDEESSLMFSEAVNE